MKTLQRRKLMIDEPLFMDGLGLDSVEALDVVAGLEEIFKIKVQGMPENETSEHFYSVETLSKFVFSQLEEKQAQHHNKIMIGSLKP